MAAGRLKAFNHEGKSSSRCQIAFEELCLNDELSKDWPTQSPIGTHFCIPYAIRASGNECGLYYDKMVFLAV